MQFIRTLTWALLTGLLVAFVAINWTPVRVNVWPDSSDYLGYIHLQGPMGLLILLAFVLGWLPTWLFGMATRWRLNRRMAHLENTVRVQPTEPLPTVAHPVVVHPATPVEPDQLG